MAQLYKRKGPDVLVNTESAGNQLGANIALLSGGGFVVVWTDSSALGGDTSSSGIKAQRYDADGNKVGVEFLVNTTTAGAQTTPVVTGLPSGRFVVTWTDASATGGDTSGTAVRGQMFEANGTAVGSEFLVNTQATNGQGSPAITEISGGGFVISWTDASALGGDTSSSGVKAQIFSAAGVPVGAEILLNTTTAGAQSGTSIATLGAGFVAVWLSPASGGTQLSLQRFNGSGDKIGTEQVVNAVTQGILTTPNITKLTLGFVVTWAQQDSNVISGLPVTTNVRGQLFNLVGNKVGAEFQINTTTYSSQSATDVDELPGGGFIVTWQGPGAGTTGFNIFGQLFDASGNKVGTEFLVTEAAGVQGNPEVEVLPSGDIAVVWTDNAGDASGSSVWMQILTLTTDAPTDIAISGTTISETPREDAPLLTFTTAGALNSSFTYTLVSDSTGGAFRIEGDRLVVQDASLLDYETIQQAEIRVRTTDLNGHSYEETFQLGIVNEPERGYVAITGEIQIAPPTAQLGNIGLVALAGGGFLSIIYQSDGNTGSYSAQFFTAAGVATGSPIALFYPEAVVALPNGGFIIANADPLLSDGTDIFIRTYDAGGALVGSPVQVNTGFASGTQSEPAISLLANGGFVVSWNTPASPPSALGDIIRFQIFDAAGAKVGGETQVPIVVPDAASSQIAGLANGNFVVTWRDGGISAQIFTAAGVRYGPELRIAEYPQTEPKITALANGGFVVTYSQYISSPPFSGLSDLTMQVFDAEGRQLGDAIKISEDGPTLFGSTEIAALPWGGFVVAWTDHFEGDGTGDEIRMQIFDATGQAMGAPQWVNTDTAFTQGGTQLAVLGNGDIVISWYDQNGQGAGAPPPELKLRIFSGTGLVEATPGADTLDGTPFADTIDGLGGNDTINGLAGDDNLTGGAGDDVVHGGNDNDTIFELSGANDQLFGDDGNDRITWQGGPGVMTVLLDGGNGDDVLTVGGVSFSDTVTLNGGSGRDRFIMNGGAALTINAGADADLVQIHVPGTSADITLGTGADLVVFNDEGFQEGVVTIHDFTAGNGGDQLNLAGVLISAFPSQWSNPFGTGAMTLTQEGAHAVLRIDTDAIAGALTTTIVLENVLASSLTAYNLGYNSNGTAVSGVVVPGTATADYLTGLGGNDVVAGGNGNDIMFGGAGSDTLYGNGDDDEMYGQLGDDYIDGGAGKDRMSGGVGNDTFIVRDVGDMVFGEPANFGFDAVYTFVSFGLTDDIQIEWLSAIDNAAFVSIDLTGSSLGQFLMGNNGTNVIDGRGGADFMQGFGGDDIYYVDNVGDAPIEQLGGGYDRVYTSISYLLPTGREIEELSVVDSDSTQAIDLIGNEFFQILRGNNGANALDGSGGFDTMYGAGGNDTYYVDHVNDRAVEESGGGFDAVYTRVSFSLEGGSEIEWLSAALAGSTDALNLTGNDFGQYLLGNNGANVLDGRGGTDFLYGYGGADTFVFAVPMGSVDYIRDFEIGIDKIALDDAIFTQLGGPGALNADMFVSASHAQDANDRILYDRFGGTLYYDADGTGAIAQVAIASISNLNVTQTLTASDFVVI